MCAAVFRYSVIANWYQKCGFYPSVRTLSVKTCILKKPPAKSVPLCSAIYVRLYADMSDFTLIGCAHGDVRLYAGMSDLTRMGFAQQWPRRDKNWAEKGREEEFPVSLLFFLVPFIFEAFFRIFCIFWEVFWVEVCPEKDIQATQVMRVILLIFLLGRRPRAASQ